jgi:FMN phosphatase YigB (HAD superfamily)
MRCGTILLGIILRKNGGTMNQALVDAFVTAECFLWDFDGCFADTERVHYLAYSEAFAHFGHTLTEAEYYPSFTHLGDGTRREIAANNLSIPEEYVLRLKAQAYGRLISLGPVRCFPETLEIVRAMKSRGAKVAIASNSSESEIRTVLTTAGYPFEELDLIVGKMRKCEKSLHRIFFFMLWKCSAVHLHGLLFLKTPTVV